MNISFCYVLGIAAGIIVSACFSMWIVSRILKRSNDMGDSEAQIDDFTKDTVHIYNFKSELKEMGNIRLNNILDKNDRQ